MRTLVLLGAVFSLALGSAPAANAACNGPDCRVRAGKAFVPKHPQQRARIQHSQRLPLRPYDGDQGGSYRPSFGCNVMGCD